jgi:DNA-binding transcriptional LysR family regulator
MMELRQLRYFLAVAEELHFRRAAERLRIAQPALTRNIRELETELGVLLFQRTTRNVVLTAAGETLRAHCSDIFSGVERARFDVKRTLLQPVERLTVTYVPSVAYTLMPQVLREFRLSGQTTELDIKSMFAADQFNGLLQSTIDVAILRPWRKTPEIRSERIISEPFVVAVPKGHPMAGRRNVPLRAFEPEPFIMHARPFTPGATQTFELIMTMFRKAGIEPVIAREAPQDMHMAMLMVAAGLGVSLLPRSLMNWPVADVGFAEIRERSVKSDISISYHVDNDRAAVQAFVAATRTAARQLGLAIGRP